MEKMMLQIMSLNERLNLAPKRFVSRDRADNLKAVRFEYPRTISMLSKEFARGLDEIMNSADARVRYLILMVNEHGVKPRMILKIALRQSGKQIPHEFRF